MVKKYEITHSVFYHMLSSDGGKTHLAHIIKTVCELLKKVVDIGMIYGNLRLENILVKLNQKHTKIEHIAFIGFGSVVSIQQSNQIVIPE